MFSQELQIPELFKLREAKAPVAVKNKLAAARREIASKNLQYVVGYTSKADLPIEKITGLKQLKPDEQRQFIARMKAKVMYMRDTATTDNNTTVNFKHKPRPKPKPVTYIYGNPSMPKLDLRKGGFVSPIRDQGPYGSCWAFSAMAAYESSFKIINSRWINTSEQHIINCSGAGTSAHGGWMSLVFDWMVDNNKDVADERVLEYAGPDQSCPAHLHSNDYFAVTWGVVDPSGDLSKIPTVFQIKQALCEHGVLSTALFADSGFQLYVGGIFSSFQSGEHNNVNHAVAIIGWNDEIQCWLIKNSWGQDWGNMCGTGNEFGYMWIKYNSSNIGEHTIWVKAKDLSHS